jgi:hypothetical protein
MHQLVHDMIELAHGTNLLAINGHQIRIGQPFGNGLLAFLAGEQGVGAAFDLGAVLAFDRQELFAKGAAPQLRQAGELLQEILALLFQFRVIGRWGLHIVAILLQYTR